MITVSGVLSGAGALTNTGSATLVLSNTANTFSFRPIISGSSMIAIAADGSLGTTPLAGSIDSIASVTLTGGGTLKALGTLALGATRGITVSGSGTLSIPTEQLTMNGLITTTTSDVLTITGNGGTTTSPEPPFKLPLTENGR